MKIFPSANSVFTAVAAILCVACSGTTRSSGKLKRIPDLTYAGFPVTLLRLTRAVIATALPNPAVVRYSSGVLVVLDRTADTAVHVLDARSGATLGAFGTRGTAPEQFVGVWSVDPASSGDGRTWIFDLTQRRMHGVNIGTWLAQRHRGLSNPPGQTLVTFAADAALTNPTRLSDGTFVSPGFFYGGRLARFDSAGHLLTLTGPEPVGDTTVPTPVRQHAYQITFAPDSARKRFVAATWYGGAISILNLAGQSESNIVTPFRFDPQYRDVLREGEHVMLLTPDARNGYIDAAATERYIFALFSGRSQASGRRRAGYAEYVHVFTWGGKLIGVLHLAAEAGSIAVSPDGSMLYAAHPAPHGAVDFYDLSRLSLEKTNPPRRSASALSNSAGPATAKRFSGAGAAAVSRAR